MERRRCASPSPGSICKPPSSGPRWKSDWFMRSSSGRGISLFPLLSNRPDMPHIISTSMLRIQPRLARIKSLHLIVIYRRELLTLLTHTHAFTWARMVLSCQQPVIELHIIFHHHIKPEALLSNPPCC